MKIISGPGGGQQYADELGADSTGTFFYTPNGPNNTPSWADNIHASWLLAGQPVTTDSQWQYDLARHQADARWAVKRGQIVTDTVNALKPLFAAISPLDPAVFEKLIADGLANVVVQSTPLSDADKAEIARLTAVASADEEDRRDRERLAN